MSERKDTSEDKELPTTSITDQPSSPVSREQRHSQIRLPKPSPEDEAIRAKAFRDNLLKPSPSELPAKKWWNIIYDKEKKTILGRTCKSWILIIGYSIMYLIFLSTYTMFFLYISLLIIKSNKMYMSDKIMMLTYAENGIGLSAIPTSISSYPLIWYRNGQVSDYRKYIDALDSFFGNRRKNVNNDLGPCGVTPYGYSDNPCIIIKINKQIDWTIKPLDENSPQADLAPEKVRNWMKFENKLWLYCAGYHDYDKEHLGNIKYFPDPPGFDPERFPLDMKDDSPLVAIQFSNFTFGISLLIECNLWYDSGSSSLNFVLYVVNDERDKHDK